MRYVGFSSQFHDAGLSIIEEDGSVSFATHSERYSKVKYDPRLSEELMKLIKDDDVVIPDLSKMKSLSGEPKTNKKTGLKNTVEWYLEYKDLLKEIKFVNVFLKFSS